ncbi:D-glycero-beta-D-manno-heptose 1-phosphate adenylyltransferase [Eubacterium sp. MSJ-13]|uniref:D-glycero-beta-D-manno-heptose 1-phosphate adenylyltransferase n=1 Tax=Eubacterium sp. MSJ-13 TaxID=2841513 RepID=UPI001C0FE967|nr:D-glycero-beta-D-manno-heptose 1-phosphate adenylyltransferase [Eubacterium sp. MSJ-13]MBU5477624.1 D-glycero-beta-D-manno-heptose 1-phosphate adenylyltransferase [Eubacterium sp. MSJ-13]
MKSLNEIESKNILVIGDVMLDTYFTGDVKRISPEAPVPVFRKKKERSVLGGAANVVANLIAADQNVSIMTMVGNDKNGSRLKDIFKEQGVDTTLVITLNRTTTEKTRFLASNNQQVLRLDVEDTYPLGHEDCEKMLHILDEQIDKFDLILLSDYLKGLLTFEFTQGVLQRAIAKNIPTIIDVKDMNVSKYKHAYLIKPNLKELHDLTGLNVENDNEIIVASRKLKEMCHTKYILTTCGARGMVLVGDDEPYFIESVGKEVFDVTGAGDTTIAYLAACMVNGFEMRDAANIANYAAGIQVAKVGTSSVYWKEIREYLMRKENATVHKILIGKAIDTFRKDNEDKKIVFTNGCFDILHVGHIRYMQEAAKFGDILVIGLNSDASVRRLKGSERPINNQNDRAEMLSAMEFVDYVIVFDEDTPYGLIKKIHPDVLVKGGDYNPDNVVGRDIVEASGGELKLLPFVEGKSTTNIINKIKM